ERSQRIKLLVVPLRPAGLVGQGLRPAQEASLQPVLQLRTAFLILALEQVPRALLLGLQGLAAALVNEPRHAPEGGGQQQQEVNDQRQSERFHGPSPRNR